MVIAIVYPVYVFKTCLLFIYQVCYFFWLLPRTEGVGLPPDTSDTVISVSVISKQNLQTFASVFC